MVILEDASENQNDGQQGGANRTSSGETGGSGPSPGPSSAPGQANNWAGLKESLMANKVDTFLMVTRILTIIFSILFIFPVLGGSQMAFYQKALYSCAATSALRLHQRLPRFQFSRVFLSQILLEDSAHYLFYALIFSTGYPISVVLMPIFLFAVLHLSTSLKSRLTILGPHSLPLLRRFIAWIESKQQMLFRVIAFNEIFLMPIIFVMMFTGKSSLLMPFVYYRFLSLRYASMRNPYCRTVFYELRVSVEQLCNHPSCPQFLTNFINRMISFISRLAPQTMAAAS